MANKLQLNLSGGMNIHTSPLIIKDTEAELILNYKLTKLGCLTRRQGFSTFLNQPVSGKTIQGLLGGTNPNNLATFNYMGILNAGNTNRVTYYNNAGTWTATDDSSQFTTYTKMRFIPFMQYVFRVNGSNTPVSFSLAAQGTATTTNLTDTATSSPIAILPTTGAVFQARLYLNHNADGYKSRLYFSSLGRSGGTIEWDTDRQWLDVNVDDGDFITAVENAGNRLLIFKNYALYRWVYGQLEADRIIGVGTSSQDSVKTNFDIGITFFANAKGVYAYSGAAPKLISTRIQPFIDAVTDWTTVAAGIDEQHYRLSVGDITVNGRVYTNAEFCYNFLLDAWTVNTLGVRPMVYAQMPGTYPTQRLYFGSTDGRTYLMNDTTSDNTAKIAAEFISKEYLLNFPNRTNFTWLDVFALPRVEALAFYDLDRLNQFQELGALTQRITNFRIPTRECNSLRVKIADNSTDISVIEGFNVTHDPKEKRDEMAVNLRRQKP